MYRNKYLVTFATLIALLCVACDSDDDTLVPGAESFSATLTGQSQVPPVTTNASGTATFTVQEGVVDFQIDVENLENVVAAHIHGPAGTDENAGIIIDLFESDTPVDIQSGTLVDGTFTGADLTGEINLGELLTLMRDGQTYVNVHTTANPPGEIRGQIQQD